MPPTASIPRRQRRPVSTSSGCCGCGAVIGGNGNLARDTLHVSLHAMGGSGDHDKPRLCFQRGVRASAEGDRPAVAERGLWHGRARSGRHPAGKRKTDTAHLVVSFPPRHRACCNRAAAGGTGVLRQNLRVTGCAIEAGSGARKQFGAGSHEWWLSDCGGSCDSVPENNSCGPCRVATWDTVARRGGALHHRIERKGSAVWFNTAQASTVSRRQLYCVPRGEPCSPVFTFSIFQ